MLTSIICLPLMAALLLVLIPRNYRPVIRGVALLATLATLVLATLLFLKFDAAAAGPGGYKFARQVPWVESLGISYHVGVDGLNLGLIFMGAIVAFAAACVSWEIKSNEKEFYILLLVMTGGILGAFASLDLFFFYFFHELALVPTFIMIGVWGRGEDKNYATFQITLYLSVGALIALLGLIALYLQSGANTFDIPELTAHLRQNPLSANAQHFICPMLRKAGCRSWPGSASATWSIAVGWQCGKKTLIGWQAIRVWPTWVLYFSASHRSTSSESPARCW